MFECVAGIVVVVVGVGVVGIELVGGSTSRLGCCGIMALELELGLGCSGRVVG